MIFRTILRRKCICLCRNIAHNNTFCHILHTDRIHLTNPLYTSTTLPSCTRPYCYNCSSNVSGYTPPPAINLCTNIPYRHIRHDFCRCSLVNTWTGCSLRRNSLLCTRTWQCYLQLSRYRGVDWCSRWCTGVYCSHYLSIHCCMRICRLSTLR